MAKKRSKKSKKKVKRTSSKKPRTPKAKSVGSPSDLIVLVKPDGQQAADRVPAEDAVHSLLGEFQATMTSIFGGGQGAAGGAPDLANAQVLPDFRHVQTPQEGMEELRDRLLELDTVEAAYIKPPSSPPVAEEMNTMVPLSAPAPSQTPDFRARQGYLDSAPGGVDARFAWQFAGGRGLDVRIIDCEWGWRFTHEDLQQIQGGVVVGTNSSGTHLVNHGTAVIGEYSGDRNSFGIEGFCSDAEASAAGFGDGSTGRPPPTSAIIRNAANLLRAGDIMLLEIHRPGPDASGFGQDGFIAIEWWPDDFAAIQYAISRGIVVVEAAGNGSRDLNANIFDQRPFGFPTTWRNPFNPANPNSGAIVVGAGAPPQGTHGRDIHGPDRSRLDFSNYGTIVDCQGWGREVTTTGYGDLQGGSNHDLWYTDTFSGTSSASPIVVGALGCLQGILKANNQTPLTPQAARRLLRSTGSPQQDAPGRPRTQRIGNRPDLREMIQREVILSPSFAGSPISIPSSSNGQPIVIHIHADHVTVNTGNGEEG